LHIEIYGETQEKPNRESRRRCEYNTKLNVKDICFEDGSVLRSPSVILNMVHILKK
jgi:hypothetical protein